MKLAGSSVSPWHDWRQKTETTSGICKLCIATYSLTGTPFGSRTLTRLWHAMLVESGTVAWLGFNAETSVSGLVEQSVPWWQQI